MSANYCLSAWHGILTAWTKVVKLMAVCALENGGKVIGSPLPLFNDDV
jgi:hypothetical protein